MTAMKDKVSGAIDKTVGTVKQKIGEATDNKELEAKGAAQRLKGHGETLKGDVKDAVNKV